VSTQSKRIVEKIGDWKKEKKTRKKKKKMIKRRRKLYDRKIEFV